MLLGEIDARAPVRPDGGPHGADEALEGARRQAATMLARLRAVEADRDAWRRECADVARERDRALARLRRLQGSRSYRLGRGLVTLARNPVTGSARLVRRAVGLVRRAVRRLLRMPAKAPGTAEGRAGPAATAARRPVYAYVALGLEPDGLRDLVRAVAQCATVCADHLPVVVTDNPSFSRLGDLGVIMEYLPDRPTWERHRDDLAWDVFLPDRLAQVFRDHRARRTILVDPSGVPGLPALLAITAGPD